MTRVQPLASTISLWSTRPIGITGRSPKLHGVLGNRSGPLTIGVIALLLMSTRVWADDAEHGSCSKYENEFAASHNFVEAEIVGDANTKVLISKVHSSACGRGSLESCKGNAYLISGDRVERGATCDGTTHILYRGKTTFVGWIDSAALRDVSVDAGDQRRTAKAASRFSKSDLANLQGYYSSSGHCVITGKPGRPQPCGQEADSCMLITRIDEKHVRLNIESLQTNAHECGISGIAEFRGSKLVYVQGSEGNEDDHRGLEVETSGPKLTIRYLADRTPHDTNAFCATNATLEGLAFSKSAKRSTVGRTCGSNSSE